MWRLYRIGLLLPLVAWVTSIGFWTAHAEKRGIAVKIRAEDSIGAPVIETVQLYDKSYALVIGIDTYTSGWPPLHNAVSDAQEVATELKNRGFEVTFKKNPKSSELQQSLKKFFAIKGSDPEARLFLWFAGHGHTIKGEGFLVPADAPQPISPEFKLKAIHMRDFAGFMRLAESKHVFAIFDSCFAGTIFEARAGAIPAAITRATTLPVRQFLSSGDANQTVSDDGAFRKLFLRGVRGEERADANGDGYLTASEMGLYLSDRITNLTEQAQTPRYGKLRDPDFDRGDFVFLLPGHLTPEGETASLPSVVPTGQDAMVEITYWASVAASENPADFETYLQKYPNGNFAVVAHKKIESLKSRETGHLKETQKDKESKVKPEDQETPLQISSGQEISEVGKPKQVEWMPTAPSQKKPSFKISAQTELGNLFISGTELAAISPDHQVPASAKVIQETKEGRIAAKDWQFSNPQGDGMYKIDGQWIHMRANGGRNIWDCNRGQAPMLTVEAPRTQTWTAWVKFEMPTRVGPSHVGLVLWNGREDKPVHALYVGPANTNEVMVSGSYRDDCSGNSLDLSRIKGNSGDFRTNYGGTNGWLRISRTGMTYRFYFKSPFKKQWQELGAVLTTVKDGFDRIGLIAKTWGNPPVQVSFDDFRILPGVAGFKPWVPNYVRKLEKSPEMTFSGDDFSDFEWSDPQGDSLQEISGNKIFMKTKGGHNIWDCNRGQAPMLTMKAPPTETWTVQVKFEMPTRVGASHVGLVLWNGSEDKPVHALYVGPGETKEVVVSGSYRDDCSGHSLDLSRIKGNSGDFRTKYEGTMGWLRITKKDDTYSFFFRSPFKKQWQELGSVLTTVKDGFDRIGMITKTWAGNPVSVTFSDFKMAVGVAGTRPWIPSYFARLKNGESEVFYGKEFADFEWSDPQGDSMHRISGSKVLMKANGGHNIWNCDRGLAPMLTVEAPPRETWIAQVRFQMPERVGNSHVGMVIWNGNEDKPAYALYFGPGGTNDVVISGSYGDDCSGAHYDLAKIPENSGEFLVKYDGTSGLLRVVKTGTTFRFWVRLPGSDTWQDLGSVLTTAKDSLNRVGMIAKTWSAKPVEVTFSDFTILPGGWR
jgi:hypothetical protein